MLLISQRCPTDISLSRFTLRLMNRNYTAGWALPGRSRCPISMIKTPRILNTSTTEDVIQSFITTTCFDKSTEISASKRAVRIIIRIYPPRCYYSRKPRAPPMMRMFLPENYLGLFLHDMRLTKNNSYGVNRESSFLRRLDGPCREEDEKNNRCDAHYSSVEQRT